ncbi:DUF4157 domain-containing protein [Aulosira sp. FACHB-615]|uniref:eCIS core domain-containing protein n=1 Tax=Aulosira sp. FACHB-615 TaxID=2692777 RepID=UPI001F54C746|nr:DUF4157 domain-containing protein [Aulosira sp. FACHB-615]
MNTRTNTHKPMSSNSMRSTILSLSKISTGSCVPSTETLQEESLLHSNRYSYENFHTNLSTLRRTPRKSSQNATSSTLPKKLKIGLEQLSGIELSEVRVHTNSSKPSRLGAIAYTKGTDIYLSPGQEKYLPHEAWHVVQQKQGRVKGKMQVAGFSINHDAHLEKEADLMGNRASKLKSSSVLPSPIKVTSSSANQFAPIQCFIAIDPKSWLNGRVPNERLLKQYFYDFEIHNEIQKLREELLEENNKVILNRVVGFYYDSYNQADSTNDYSTVLQWLTSLVSTINYFSPLLKSTGDKSVNDYEDKSSRSWKDQAEALKEMHESKGKIEKLTFIDPNIDSKNRKNKVNSQELEQHKIPTIPYSVFKEVAPNNLVRLIRDIYFSWKTNIIFDMRTEDEIKKKDITSDHPGALRSWHMNTENSLPQIPMPETYKLNKIHSHYKKTSKEMNNVSIKMSNTSEISKDKEPVKDKEPIGYAEYTGTGIRNPLNSNRDVHNVKIVLDYVTGKIYVTVSHYGNWEIKNKGQEDERYSAVGQKAGSGEFSAWFHIDMNS